MRWHSDDEPGLAPTVVSLSLGSDCQMDFRKTSSREKGTTRFQKTILSVDLHHVCPEFQFADTRTSTDAFTNRETS